MSAIATSKLAVDPHADWAKQAAAIYSRIPSIPDDENGWAAVHRLTLQADVYEELISRTPSETLAGAAEQLRCALRYGALAGESVEGTAVRSALAMLERAML